MWCPAHPPSAFKAKSKHEVPQLQTSYGLCTGTELFLATFAPVRVNTLSAFPQDSTWVEEKQLLIRTNQDLLEKVCHTVEPRPSPGSGPRAVTGGEGPSPASILLAGPAELRGVPRVP